MIFDKASVGTAIKKMRKSRNLSQEVLSGLAGIGRSHLAMIESGKKQPNLETIWKIAYALEIEPHSLICEIEKEILSKAD